LFSAENDALSKTIAGLLLRHVERGSAIYTDEFRGYERVSRLGYGHFRVKHFGGVYAVGPVHVNNAESRNWHLRAFLFFKRGVSVFLAEVLRSDRHGFCRALRENPIAVCHRIIEVLLHV